MTVTFEIDDALFELVVEFAAKQGITPEAYIIKAIDEHLDDVMSKKGG